MCLECEGEPGWCGRWASFPCAHRVCAECDRSLDRCPLCRVDRAGHSDQEQRRRADRDELAQLVRSFVRAHREQAGELLREPGEQPPVPAAPPQATDPPQGRRPLVHFRLTSQGVGALHLHVASSTDSELQRAIVEDVRRAFEADVSRPAQTRARSARLRETRSVAVGPTEALGRIVAALDARRGAASRVRIGISRRRAPSQSTP